MEEQRIKISPVNLTVLAFMKNDLYLESMSRLIICYPYPDFTYSMKKVPFLGKNDVIVGNKSYSWESTGVRCQGNGESLGAMKNCISIDYQIKGSNYNIKIYRNKMHMVGMESKEEAEEVSRALVNHLKRLDEIWYPFFELSVEERVNFIHQKIIPLLFHFDKSGKYSMRDIDDEFSSNYELLLENNPNFKLVINELLKKITFYEDYWELYVIYRKICELKINVDFQNVFCSFSDEKDEFLDLDFKKFSILEGTYTGDLMFNEVPLLDLCRELERKDLKGFSFHNQKGKEIRIITKEGLDDKIITKTSSKIPYNQINISDSGNVRVNSPAEVEVIQQESSKILKIVSEFLDTLPENDIDSTVENAFFMLDNDNDINIEKKNNFCI